MKYNKLITLMSVLLLLLAVAPSPFTTLSANERESAVEHRQGRGGLDRGDGRDRRNRRDRRDRYRLGEEKIDKFFMREYWFRADDVRAGRLVLKTRNGSVEIRRIEILYSRGDVVDLDASGRISEGRRARLLIPRGRVRSVIITARSSHISGSRSRLGVLLAR